VAIIAEHAATAIPGYSKGLAGAARSMPTSTAIDRVAQELEIPCFETPTGWKFFGSLMDAGKCTICGEESFGTGSDHVREKDGVWAVLAWLSILAHTGKSVEQVVHDHWKRFGRSYYQRHDHEGLSKVEADAMFAELRESLPSMSGQQFAGIRISHADDFSYTDPIDGSVSTKQGVRILLEDGSRVVYRLSGTGTEGATLRIYLESFNRDDLFRDPQDVLAPLAKQGRLLLRLKDRFGSDQPTVVT
jgi:phosphoglucomutase